MNSASADARFDSSQEALVALLCRLFSACYWLLLMSRNMPIRHQIAIALLIYLAPSLSSAYELSVGPTGRPQVDRRALAGLWKLTLRPTMALKEFTTYPKKKQTKIPNLLLMLKEDGSFKQYHDDGDDDDEEGNPKDVNQSWESFAASRKSSLTAVQNGVWDLVDGRLVLAADRPEQERIIDVSKDDDPLPDTVLEGQVVASWNKDDSQQHSNDKNTEKSDASPNNTNDINSRRAAQERAKAAIMDTRLSVPLGRIQVGRFFYPKKHPSFFEQPIFRPQPLGAFELNQVLGSLQEDSSRISENDELFFREDFFNKTFLLTSHPIVPKQPKGRKRWSIKYNRFVHDDPKKEAQAAADEAARNRLLCRVTRITFHPNGTFCTLPTLDDDTILRGKYDLMGPKKNQLWFQVWRFGFGRSVSGSTYSQGRMLTQDDAKTYWGTIRYQNPHSTDDDEDEEEHDESPGVTPSLSKESNENNNDQPRKLEVKGSVLFGLGLEPLPVGRFIMRETDDLSLDLDYDDEEEDEEDDDFNPRLDALPGSPQDGVDWGSGGGFE